MADLPVRDMSSDGGNGHTKVVSSTGSWSFPSVVAQEDETAKGFSAQGLASNNDFIIEFNGQSYAIGDTVYTEGLMPMTIRDRSRITTDYFKTLFAAQLALSIQQPAVVHAIVSLPPAAYGDREKLKEVLSGEYEIGFKGRTLNYVVPKDKMKVVIEGFGTATLLCLRKNGDLNDSWLFDAEVGIADIGTYTTDLVRLSNMKLNRSGTESHTDALGDLHTKLRNYASSQGKDIKVYEADQVLRDGYWLQSGRRVPIAHMRETWSKELAQVVATHIRNDWSGGDDVQYILLTGGGALYVANFLQQEFNHVHVVDEEMSGVLPWLANAEGAFRYMKFLTLMAKAGQVNAAN